MVIFVAAGQFKPGKTDQALEALRAFMPTVQAEAGTLKYAVYRGVQNPDMVVFFEKYADEAAQRAHWSSEEFAAFQEALGPLMDGQPFMGVVEKVASKS